MNKIWFKRLALISMITIDLLVAVSMAAVIYMSFSGGGEKEQLKLLEGYVAEGDYLSLTGSMNQYGDFQGEFERYQEIAQGYQYSRLAEFWQQAYEKEGKEEYQEKQLFYEEALENLTEATGFQENISILQSFR